MKVKTAMSVIKLPLLFAGSRGGKNLYTLFDSGENLSCIDKSHLENLEQPVSLGRVRKLSLIRQGHYIEISERVTLYFYINDILLSDEFLVVPSLSEEVIIGAATLQKWRIKLNFETDNVEVDAKLAKLQLI